MLNVCFFLLHPINITNTIRFFIRRRKVIHIFLKYDTVLKRPDIMEQLAAEREHFLKSLNALMKELKGFLTDSHKSPEDLEISAVCWETKGLKLFQNEVKQWELWTHLCPIIICVYVCGYMYIFF